jgi:hypothetical protein
MILKAHIQLPVFPNGVDYAQPDMPKGYTQIDAQKHATTHITNALGARMYDLIQVTHHDEPGHTMPPLVDRVFTGSIGVFAPSHLQLIVQMIKAVQMVGTPMQKMALDEIIDELLNK